MTSPSFTGALGFNSWVLSATGNSASYTTNNGDTAFLFIGLQTSSGTPATVSSVTGTSRTWTKFHGYNGNGPTYVTLEIWYSKNTSGSAITESASITASTSNLAVDNWIGSVTGANSSLFDSHSSNPTDANETATNSYSASITTSQTNDLVVAFMGNPSSNVGSVPTTPSGWTQLARGGFSTYGIDNISVSSIQSPRTWSGTASVTDANNQGAITIFAITSGGSTRPLVQAHISG